MRLACFLYVLPLVLATALGAGLRADELSADELSAEAWLAAFGPVDAAAILGERDLAARSGLRITGLDPQGLAERAGLAIGDVVVGLNGLRVYGHGDFNLIRYEHGGDQDPMVVSVLRGDDVITVAMTPWKYRNLECTSTTPNAAMAILAAAGIPIDPQQDPLGYRAWLQFPKRELYALERWLAPGRTAEELTWFHALDRQHRALCVQDFAAAAAETVAAPLPELQPLTQLYAALAERHRHGEIAPDPARHGQGLLDWIRRYPYPILIGPAVGAVDPEWQPFAADLERLRMLPIALGGAPPTPTTFTFPDWPLTASYANAFAMAMFDPIHHGDAPYRHELVTKPESRAQLLAELDAAIAMGGPQTWLLEQVAMIPRLLQEAPADESRERVTAVCLATAKHAPLIGYLGLQIFTASGPTYHRLWNLRSPVRRAYRAGGFQLSPKPSPFLEHLQAHDAWNTFFLTSHDNGNFESQLDRILVALRHARSIEDFESGVEALDAHAGLPERIRLIDEYIDRYRGWCTHDDMLLLERIVGNGQASGALLARAPAIWRAMERNPRCVSFSFRLNHLISPYKRGYDLRAMAAGVAAIDWKDPAPSCEQLFLTTGNVLSTLMLADACAEHGHPELGEHYRAQVRTYFATVERHAKVSGWNNTWLARAEWRELHALSSSVATADAAVAVSRDYLRHRDARTSWTAAWLSLAQAQVLLGRHEDAADALASSFVDMESKALDEPFVWPGGRLILGEPQQRLEVLRQLATSGALAPLRGRIIAKAKAAMVPAEFAELLGVNPHALGEKAPEPGLNDF